MRKRKERREKKKEKQMAHAKFQYEKELWKKIYICDCIWREDEQAAINVTNPTVQCEKKENISH